MIAPITFVPTPRLDYTQIYNEFKEDYRVYSQQQQREQDRNEKLRLEKFQEEQRMNEKRELVKELEDVKRYEQLAKLQAYREYKYAYYVGTLVDTYI